MKQIHFSYKLLYFFATSLLISGPALLCQYPIINGDSDNYIWQSIKLIGMGTNPIGYSLFIRGVTWQFSLWPVVFAQGIILSLFIYFILQSIFNNKTVLLMRHFAIITFLSMFTGMAWISSQIMVDIFGSISIMALYLFFLPNTKLYVKIISSIVLGFTFLLHFSFPIIAIFTMGAFLMHYLIKHKTLQKVFLLKGSIVIGMLILSSLFNAHYNTMFTEKKSPTNIRHVLLMARLMETGILDEFLEENCKDNRYALCNYKDQFPANPSTFVWASNSVFSKTGSWNNSKEEYNEIIYRIFSDPYYLSLFSYKSLVSSAKQFFTFKVKIRAFNKSKRDIRTSELIEKNFKHETKKFKTSLQFLDIDLTVLNRSYYLFTGLSMIIVVLFLIGKKSNYKSNLWFLTFIIFLSVLINAFVNGSFSNVVPRYQARVNWMIVFLALIIIQKYFFPALKYTINKVNGIGNK